MSVVAEEMGINVMEPAEAEKYEAEMKKREVDED